MEDDTKKLLKECNSGCKSATNSMEQVMEFIKDNNLKELIEKYNKAHIRIGDECHQMLNKINEEEKDPQTVAKTMAWFSTELKLIINDDISKIADILIDGCNMGIKSLSKYLNKYKEASSDSIGLTHKLIKIEQDMMNDLLMYL